MKHISEVSEPWSSLSEILRAEMTYHDGILRYIGIKPLFDFDRNPKLHMYILLLNLSQSMVHPKRLPASNGAAKRWKEGLNTNETTQNIERWLDH